MLIIQKGFDIFIILKEIDDLICLEADHTVRSLQRSKCIY